VSWSCTTFLDIAFLALAAVLLIRFRRTGGGAMLRMMGGAPDTGHTGHGAHTGHTAHAEHGPSART
jgi:hypothetical protein